MPENGHNESSAKLITDEILFIGTHLEANYKNPKERTRCKINLFFNSHPIQNKQVIMRESFYSTMAWTKKSAIG